MPKKLKLDDLKVQSFVTALENTEDQTQAVKGGDVKLTWHDCSRFLCSMQPGCHTWGYWCPPDDIILL